MTGSRRVVFGLRPSGDGCCFCWRVIALASSAGLAMTVALWLAAFFVNPWDCHLSVGDTFHVGVWGGVDGPMFGRVVLFNDREYGPYRGSIIALSDGRGGVWPRHRVSGWGDACGVYYRHFYFADSGRTLWTVMVSLLYPFVAFAIVPLAWVWRRVRAGVA